MQLKNQVEWALHCCAILAGLPEGRYFSTKGLAEFHGIPKEYLSKALQGLSQAGLVESTLGPSGGYRLAKKPAAISFLEIVQAIEGRAHSFACTHIRNNNPCRPEGYCDTKPCAVARIMWEAEKAWEEKLRAVSLADLQQTLVQDIPPKILKKTAEWIAGYSQQ